MMHKKARSFEISKLKNLEKLWNPPEVTRICNWCRIRARCINDKNNNIYKTKRNETIHMLIFTISNLKNAKMYKPKQVLVSRKTVYSSINKVICNFYILFLYYVLYFPLWTFSLHFPCFPCFFTDCTWKLKASTVHSKIHSCFIKGRSLVSLTYHLRKLKMKSNTPRVI